MRCGPVAWRPFHRYHLALGLQTTRKQGRDTLNPRHAKRLRQALLGRRAFLEAEKAATYETPPTHWERLRRFSRKTVGLAVLHGFGLYDRGYRNAERGCRRDIVLSPPQLPPALGGLRVLFVADFHFRPDSAMASAAALLDGAACDLCILGGDFLWGFSHRHAHVAPMLEAFLAGLAPPLGIYAILGNHDFAHFAQAFRAFGVRTLTNENVRLQKGAASFWLAGTDDATHFKTHHLDMALAGIPADAFTILACHGPELAGAASCKGVHLYLCGHTHWGQIRVPGLGGFTYNSSVPRRFCVEQWSINGMAGYTTAGIGTTELPVRFGCPAEAALITLRRPT